ASRLASCTRSAATSAVAIKASAKASINCDARAAICFMSDIANLLLGERSGSGEGMARGDVAPDRGSLSTDQQGAEVVGDEHVGGAVAELEGADGGLLAHVNQRLLPVVQLGRDDHALGGADQSAGGRGGHGQQLRALGQGLALDARGADGGGHCGPPSWCW